MTRPVGHATPCRYREPTGFVSAGTLVRHPACPQCGQRLAYRVLDGVALRLHADDPWFRLAIVSVAPTSGTSPGRGDDPA